MNPAAMKENTENAIMNIPNIMALTVRRNTSSRVSGFLSILTLSAGLSGNGLISIPFSTTTISIPPDLFQIFSNFFHLPKPIAFSAGKDNGMF
jgi:hypothetical protein